MIQNDCISSRYQQEKDVKVGKGSGSRQRKIFVIVDASKASLTVVQIFTRICASGAFTRVRHLPSEISLVLPSKERVPYLVIICFKSAISSLAASLPLLLKILKIPCALSILVIVSNAVPFLQAKYHETLMSPCHLQVPYPNALDCLDDLDDPMEEVGP